MSCITHPVRGAGVAHTIRSHTSRLARGGGPVLSFLLSWRCPPFPRDYPSSGLPGWVRARAGGTRPAVVFRTYGREYPLPLHPSASEGRGDPLPYRLRDPPAGKVPRSEHRAFQPRCKAFVLQATSGGCTLGLAYSCWAVSLHRRSLDPQISKQAPLDAGLSLVWLGARWPRRPVPTASQAPHLN